MTGTGSPTYSIFDEEGNAIPFTDRVGNFSFDKKPIMSFDLDCIAHWEFHHKDKIYKLNAKEVLKLLKEIKKCNKK